MLRQWERTSELEVQSKKSQSQTSGTGNDGVWLLPAGTENDGCLLPWVGTGVWERCSSSGNWKERVNQSKEAQSHKDGSPEVIKEKAFLNDEDKSVTLIGFEGDVMQEYKTWKVVFHANPKGEGSSLVKVSIECEKIKEEIPAPNNYLNFMVNVIKDIEAHHLKG
ncbi:Major latex-like protein [Quillaja saponaria]|uniref:Major latex-like protein n=1 Tax=Quillaja saponaria TaxID=32244 RepID=A0AAD7KN91_QUISA|nr:Major latex-like protein [Quillaja saponaria]